jgi:hypothetical protein
MVNFILIYPMIFWVDWEKEIKFVERDGGFVIKKPKYESIELDIDDEELFKYMKDAHKNLLSLNEWVEKCLTKFIEVNESPRSSDI